MRRGYPRTERLISKICCQLHRESRVETKKRKIKKRRFHKPYLNFQCIFNESKKLVPNTSIDMSDFEGLLVKKSFFSELWVKTAILRDLWEKKNEKQGQEDTSVFGF